MDPEDSPRRLTRVTWANAVAVVVSGSLILGFAMSELRWELRVFNTIFGALFGVYVYREAKAW